MGIGAHWGSPGASPSTERCSSQLGLLCRGMPRAAGSTQALGGLREELGLLWLSNKGGRRDCWHREGWGGHG